MRATTIPTARSTPSSGCRPTGSATSRPATAPRCRANVVAARPGRGRARTRPSSSTPATRPSNPDSRRLRRRCSTRSGYAYVGVNMRGTGLQRRIVPLLRVRPEHSTATTRSRPSPRSRGCSTTRSAWSASRYPGISQLFVAADAAAEPRRDHPAVGDRRQLPQHALPGRHPQHRVRRRRGRRTRADQGEPYGQEWAAERVDAGDAVCDRTRRCGCRTPTSLAEIDDNPFYDRRAGRRRLAPRHVRRPASTVPDVPRRRVAGRADRRPLPDDARPRSPAPTTSTPRSSTGCTPSRSARSILAATSSSSTCTSARAHAVARAGPRDRPRARRRRSSASTRSRSRDRPVRRDDLRRRPRRVRGGTADPGAVRGGRRRRVRAGTPGAARSCASVRRVADPRAPSPTTWCLDDDGRARRTRRPATRPRSTYTADPDAHPGDVLRRRLRRATSGGRRRRTTGRSRAAGHRPRRSSPRRSPPTRSWSGPGRSTCGSTPTPATPTSRSPSARSAPTAGDVRPERLAARQPPRPRRRRVDRRCGPCTPTSRPTPPRCRPAMPELVRVETASRSPTRSAPGRRSGSPSTRPAATGRCGRSTRSPTVRSVHDRPRARDIRRRSCCPSSPASTCRPATPSAASLRGPAVPATG